jgi:hypothetical protein
MLLLSPLALNVSCKGTDSPAGATTIEVDLYGPTNPEEIFDSYEYVALETTEDNLIGDISAIEVTDSRIYVLDKRMRKACFVFDREGKYIGKIDRMGRGPGEYTYIQDMQVHDGLVYFLTFPNAVMVYTEEGKFVKKHDLKDRFNHFMMLDENTIWLSSEKSNDTGYEFILYDCNTGEYVAQVDPFEKRNEFGYQFQPFTVVDEGDIWTTKRFGSTIYSLTEDALTPLYDFKFNTKEQIPDNYEEIPASDLYLQLTQQNVVSKIEAFAKRGDDILALLPETAGPTKQLFSHIIRYDTKSGEIFRTKLGYEEDAVKYLFTSGPGYFGEDFMVTSYPAFAVIDLDEHYSLGMFDEGEISPDDNPLLFFWTFK